MTFQVRNIKNNLNGLYSQEYYEPGQPILRFDGKKILRSDIDPKDFIGPKVATFLQIGTELYADLTNNNEFFINHSCNPNGGIKVAVNTAFLVAIQPVKPGDQLFFDYSTTSTEDKTTWEMTCNCGYYNCRKLITGFGSLTPKQQKYYLDLDVVPKYVRKFYNV